MAAPPGKPVAPVKTPGSLLNQKFAASVQAAKDALAIKTANDASAAAQTALSNTVLSSITGSAASTATVAAPAPAVANVKKISPGLLIGFAGAGFLFVKLFFKK